MARIVHEVDIGDERFDADGPPGSTSPVGLWSMMREDGEVLRLTGALFDGLYEYRRPALLLGTEPS
jgi:hypothetical protein